MEQSFRPVYGKKPSTTAPAATPAAAPQPTSAATKDQAANPAASKNAAPAHSKTGAPTKSSNIRTKSASQSSTKGPATKQEDTVTNVEKRIYSVRFMKEMQHTPSCSSAPIELDHMFHALPTLKREHSLKKEQDTRLLTGYLNKLTDKTFDKLSGKILEIFSQIAGTEYVEAIHAVFKKAIKEKNYIPIYARLCKALQPDRQKHPNEYKAFKTALFNRCQQEFESALVPEQPKEKVEKPKEAPKEVPKEAAAPAPKETPKEAPTGEKTEKTEEGQEDVEDGNTAIRKGKIGNIQFIGELFKVDLLVPLIITDCVEKLFETIQKSAEPHREFFVELLCELLKIVGKALDDNKNGPRYVDTYVGQITNLHNDTSFTSRGRHMLQEIIELRAQGWITKNVEPAKPAEEQTEGSQRKPSHHIQDEDPGWTIVQSNIKPKTSKSKRGGKGGANNKASPAKPRRTQKVNTENSAATIDYEEDIKEEFEEYLADGQLSDIVQYATKLPATQKVTFVSVGVIFTMEKPDSDRDTVSKLFAKLFTEGVLTEADILAGFKQLTANLPELTIDIPFAAKFVQLFVDGAVADKYLTSAQASQFNVYQH